MPEWFMQSLVAGGVAGVIAWATVRVEMRYMKRAIEAAHDRLDNVGAPPARMRL